MGFTREDYEVEAEIWPENAQAWNLFCELGGQWRTRGMDGRHYAMDYTTVMLRLNAMQLDPERWQQLYDDMRVLERATLEEWAKPS